MLALERAEKSNSLNTAIIIIAGFFYSLDWQLFQFLDGQPPAVT